MMRGRFAPSPTGPLHFGSLVAALGSWLFARSAGGTWIVRMEDLDREREVHGAAERILATLDAFGLVSDEEIVYQSRRGDRYAAALARLDRDGHAYRCWCSRADLEPCGGIHPAQCVAPAGDRAPAWRLRVRDHVLAYDDAIQGPQRQDLARETGDFVIWRADGACAYQLAVVIDDAAQGIDQVVRGADLLDSTPRQIYLQRCLGLPTPVYMHVPLVLADDGEKLSKQNGAEPLDLNDIAGELQRAAAHLGLGLPDGARRSLDAFYAAAISAWRERWSVQRQ